MISGQSTPVSDHERAAKYLAVVPTATEGGRNDALNKTAFLFAETFNLPESQFTALLSDWAGRFNPPLPEHEVATTIQSAWRGAQSKGVAGSKARPQSGRARHTTPARPAPLRATQAPQQAPSVSYDLTGAPPLPAPIENSTVQLIEALFLPGEGIRIAPAELNDDGKEVPDGGGVTFTREDWLSRLAGRGNDINQIFSSTYKTGIYIAINPYKPGCTKDNDVLSYRHALVEFDSGLSQAEQFALYQKSKLPVAAVIDSGGKSVHAWVRVDAKDRTEYDQRVSLLYGHFQTAGYTVDIANKNPGRLSRLPGCVRFRRRQELLSLRAGCDTWQEWVASIPAVAGVTAEQEVQPPVSRPLAELERFHGDDPSELLRDRYLCKRGLLLLAGPTGIGKSSFSLQCMLLWGIGREAFGIRPARPLKSLLIQAENDDGDIAEMRDGVLAGMGLTPKERDDALANVVVCQEDTRTGRAFFEEVVRPLLAAHKPDLVWIDPVLAYLGADANSGEDVSAFLRNMLIPLLRQFECGGVLVHHVNKPASGTEKPKWTAGDMAYLGSGSSEFANAPRAVLAIRSIGSHDVFELCAGKRGGRLGWHDEQGEKSRSRLIEHSKVPGQICWLETTKEEQNPKGRPKGATPDDVLKLLPPDGLTATDWKKRAAEQIGVSKTIFYDHKKELVEAKKVTESIVSGRWLPV